MEIILKINIRLLGAICSLFSYKVANFLKIHINYMLVIFILIYLM